ncbi:hypothetical protein TNCV_873661 [Trichonephila clavipes]|nr:hypothetical protein TNCV_873661 [Trichonephila clavipes]
MVPTSTQAERSLKIQPLHRQGHQCKKIRARHLPSENDRHRVVAITGLFRFRSDLLVEESGMPAQMPFSFLSVTNSPRFSSKWGINKTIDRNNQ